MSIPPSDLVRWVRRYEAAERRIAAERRESRPDPEDALARALELALLVEERGEVPPGDDPSNEDRRAYVTWARLRRTRVPGG